MIWPFYARENAGDINLVFLRLLTDAVWVQVQRGDIPLTDGKKVSGTGYIAHIHQVELDGDAGPEWLIALYWQQVDALSWLTFDESDGGGFSRLQTALPFLDWGGTYPDDGLIALQDFTGDGLTDAIFENTGYMAGTTFAQYTVVIGSADGFQFVDELYSDRGFLEAGAFYELETSENSPFLELTLPTYHDLNWGCSWEQRDTYRWPHGRKQHTVTGEQPPDSADCYLAQAVTLKTAPPDDATAIRYLESAIARFDVSDPEQRAKANFAHYRLSVLYALNGMDQPARKHLQQFIASYPENNAFRQTVLQPLLDTQPLNAFAVCTAVSTASEEVLLPEWKPYLGVTAALGLYPYSSDIVEDAICPARDILLKKLTSLDFSPDTSPKPALEDAGIPVQAAKAYILPGLDSPAWFVSVGKPRVFIFGYVPAADGGQWGWRALMDFYGTPATILDRDITGDGFPEMAFIYEPVTPFCEEGQHGMIIFLTTYTEFGVASGDIRECISPPEDAMSLLADQDSDGVVDVFQQSLAGILLGDDALIAEKKSAPLPWFFMFDVYGWNVSSVSQTAQVDRDTIDAVYTADALEPLRERILAERDALDLSRPENKFSWQSLTYLLGVTYERDGRDAEAIAAFRDVILAEPHTIWTNLAAMHLRP
ncbi:MAG: hypothetical protein D6794_10685 [Deltaproteobacteria bacterium]|nr:MAG: hypothetical protein D6794_10685 [Deltaproteobacteria bacterium]